MAINYYPYFIPEMIEVSVVLFDGYYIDSPLMEVSFLCSIKEK